MASRSVEVSNGKSHLLPETDEMEKGEPGALGFVPHTYYLCCSLRLSSSLVLILHCILLNASVYLDKLACD